MQDANEEASKITRAEVRKALRAVEQTGFLAVRPMSRWSNSEHNRIADPVVPFRDPKQNTDTLELILHIGTKKKNILCAPTIIHEKNEIGKVHPLCYIYHSPTNQLIKKKKMKTRCTAEAYAQLNRFGIICCTYMRLTVNRARDLTVRK